MCLSIGIVYEGRKEKYRKISIIGILFFFRSYYTDIYITNRQEKPMIRCHFRLLVIVNLSLH